MSSRSRRTPRTLVFAAGMTACLAVAIPAAPALGDDARKPRPPRSIHVVGQLELTDQASGRYRATGDLDGWWTIPPTLATNYLSSDTVIIQKGPEWFEGCVAGTSRCGTLNSEYISWTYQRTDKSLISGGCTHAPTGGTKRFTGVRGLVQMEDTPVGKDKVVTLYEGDLILNAVPGEAPMQPPVVKQRVAASAAASASPGC